MLNGARCASSAPSVTEICTSSYVPTSAEDGVPSTRPVVGENAAHGGRFTMLKCRMSPSASLASGTKRYGISSSTIDGGVPPIVGGEFSTTGGSSGDSSESPGGSSVGSGGGSSVGVEGSSSGFVVSSPEPDEGSSVEPDGGRFVSGVAPSLGSSGSDGASSLDDGSSPDPVGG